MRVRKHDRVDLAHGTGEARVLLSRLAPATLEHAAVQEHRVSPDAENVARARDLARRACELDLHARQVSSSPGRSNTSVRRCSSWDIIAGRHPPRLRSFSRSVSASSSSRAWRDRRSMTAWYSFMRAKLVASGPWTPPLR